MVLDMPLLDTPSSRNLTGALISDIVLQMLSYVAEQERSFIRKRQAEGIAAAKARGQRFGPPEKERPANLEYYITCWAEGSISARKVARKLQVAHTTSLKWARAINLSTQLRQCDQQLIPPAFTALRKPVLCGYQVNEPKMTGGVLCYQSDLFVAR